MRIRIVKHSRGIMDGVSLSRMLPGLTYQVSVSLGSFLVAHGAAEEDFSPSDALSVSPDQEPVSLTGGVSVTPPRDHEDERSPGKRRARQSR